MKKLLILFLLLLTILFPKEADAKVWTKDLVDKVTLDSGYKFQICTIDLNYNFILDSNFLSPEEKTFEANPEAYPCNKESLKDVLLANITLNFNKTNWNGGSSPEKVLMLEDGLYSVNQYGDILKSQDTLDPVKGNLAPLDWLSTLPSGIRAIRGSRLINSDPNNLIGQKDLGKSGFLILHNPTTGKFTAAIFVIDNKVYKISNIVSQVTTPTTLIDYTQANTENPNPTSAVLKIPEYGVQVVLSDEIKDAYYINTTASKGYVYLKVHSLDSELQCLKDDSSTAALSKVGKDEIYELSGQKYSDSFKGTTIGNYFYYIDVAQYSCAETTDGKANLEKVRKAFTNAEIAQ